MKFYVAYGSNLNTIQMKRRCPNAKIYGVGKIKDYRLLFKGSKTGSFLTIEKAKGYSVPVAIWMIDEDDELSLDFYEGYPNFYYKKDFELECELQSNRRKELIKCFAYIMHEDRPLGIPRDYYIECCLMGYETFGFSEEFIKEAYTHSLKEAKYETR